MSTTFLTELGEAEHALAEAVPLAERLAAAGDINYTEPRSLQLRVLAERGAHEQAPAIDELLATTRESGQPQDYALVLSAAVRLLLAEGHEQRASALLVELEQVVGIRADPYHAPALFELVRSAVARRQPELAIRLVDGVEPRTPLFEHALSACRAQLAEAAGEHAEAAQFYDEAAERWRNFGNMPERAYALLGWGRCLAILGKPEAEEPLRTARELFASMGFNPAVAEVDGLLGSPEAAAL